MNQSPLILFLGAIVLASCGTPQQASNKLTNAEGTSDRTCNRDSGSNSFELEDRKACVDTVVGYWTGVISTASGPCNLSLKITRDDALAKIEVSAASDNSSCLVEGAAQHSFDISENVLLVYNYENDERFIELYDSVHLDLRKLQDGTLVVGHLGDLIVPESGRDFGLNLSVARRL